VFRQIGLFDTVSAIENSKARREIPNLSLFDGVRKSKVFVFK